MAYISTIEEMQKLAEERGGKCLSKKYRNRFTKLTWQCKEGHQWDAIPANIKNVGTWCPVCVGNNPTIEQMRKIAVEHGGKCLSKTYRNRFTKLTWQCKEGHQWHATLHSIRNGRWCPACGGTKKNTIQEMQNIAQRRGGKCLSPQYINSRAKLTWQCKEGHQWDAAAAKIKNAGTWCPACAGKKYIRDHLKSRKSTT